MWRLRIRMIMKIRWLGPLGYMIVTWIDFCHVVFLLATNWMRSPPDFYILGVDKCGMTALADTLAQHSSLQMSSIKETHHLNGKFNHTPVSARFANLPISEVNGWAYHIPSCHLSHLLSSVVVQALGRQEDLVLRGHSIVYRPDSNGPGLDQEADTEREVHRHHARSTVPLALQVLLQRSQGRFSRTSSER